MTVLSWWWSDFTNVSYYSQPMCFNSPLAEESRTTSAVSIYMFCFTQLVVSFAVGRSSFKRSRASLVWTLCSKNSSENDRDSRHYQRALPLLFPWKRAAFASSLNNSSLSAIRYLSMCTFLPWFGYVPQQYSIAIVYVCLSAKNCFSWERGIQFTLGQSTGFHFRNPEF